jgi:tRNA-specific 2-thiouridylase
LDDARKNILVAMSGGVDSSVAAALLLEQGCSVSGATLKLFDNDDIAPNVTERTCCSLRDVEDARKVCARLGVAHHVFNFCENFRERVVAPFVGGYCSGLTPNPCVDCNRYIKFDGFLERAVLLGFDGMATGHYAVSQFDGASGRYLLKKPADKSKDQTYVLYGMTQHQLEKTLFPLGSLTKNEVRSRAERLSFTNAGKPDSQDICFVPDGDYAAFHRTVHRAKNAGRALCGRRKRRLGRAPRAYPLHGWPAKGPGDRVWPAAVCTRKGPRFQHGHARAK